MEQDSGTRQQVCLYNRSRTQFFCKRTIINNSQILYCITPQNKKRNNRTGQRDPTTGSECSPTAKKLSLTIVNVYIALHYKSQNKKCTLLKKIYIQIKFHLFCGTHASNNHGYNVGFYSAKVSIQCSFPMCKQHI